jgi:prolyl 4-hydroxylase
MADVDITVFQGSQALFTEHQQRQLRNLIQPRIVPPFGEVGFKKMRIPDALWSRLESFWKVNYPTFVEETAKNFEENPELVQKTYNFALPQEEKSCAHTHLQHAVEEWSGVLLEETLLFGVRVYTDGAVLDEHVDTLGTHVVSLILNVGQENIKEDWPLTIKDVNGERHQVSMKPGDMVLYESAKCQHGRPIALKGEAYANMFVHYKPAKGWDFW